MFSSYDYIENPANFALCEDCLVLYSDHENCDSLQWAKIRKKCKKFVKSLFTKKFFSKNLQFREAPQFTPKVKIKVF